MKYVDSVRIGAVTRHLQRLWDAEVDPARAVAARWLAPVALVVLVLYVLAELLVTEPIGDLLTLAELQAGGPLAPWQMAVWAGLLLLTFATRVAVATVGYFVAADGLDQARFRGNLLLYLPAAGIQVAALVLVAGLAAGLAGLGIHPIADVVAWLDRCVPTLVEVPAMPWALLLGWTLYSFTGYFLHWLGHASRLLWHVCHAPHHMPEFLHPLGAPLAFGFGFLLWIPQALCVFVLTRLFATEPLLFEAGVVALVAYNLEIFNHSTVHYDFCRRNRVLHFLAMFFGGHGAWHYVHHSAAHEHQTANLGGGLFLLWDRVFGTFVEPPRERPAVGLTGQPELYRNPLRVVFGGIARIVYEWRANKDLRTRFLILFGPIDYMPPRTREYVKKRANDGATAG